MSTKKLKRNNQLDAIREACLNDLETFINVIHPQRALARCHQDLIRWWNREGHGSHQLVLLPRDHGKSAMVAYRAAWAITKNPAIRILYISSTSNLAIKQLKFIKDILTSKNYRRLWPDMVEFDEMKREKWTEKEISVDHPTRKARIIRDPTIFTAGLTTGIVGLHCDIAILDDVVVPENAYTEEGREKVSTQASYLASIIGAESEVWVVGTRYHPNDLYASYQEQVVELYNEFGEVESSYHLFETMERTVETNGDGSGEYLWPRMQHSDGHWYGFNQEILAKKRAQYADPAQFRAQYYNNPNDYGTATIDRSQFQYFDRKLLSNDSGQWTYRGRRLNVFAGVDFAYSVSRSSDFTAIVVVGVDFEHNYYVLDVVRFKTNKISDYFDQILRLHSKWGFRKIRAETTAAQSVIVKDLKESYIRPTGLVLSIEEHRPLKNKEERIEAALQPRYSNRQMWHYKGGHCELLEQELVQQNPAHDDIKDCLASVVEIATPPSSQISKRTNKASEYKQFFHSRFGGVA